MDDVVDDTTVVVCMFTTCSVVVEAIEVVVGCTWVVDSERVDMVLDDVASADIVVASVDVFLS